MTEPTKAQAAPSEPQAESPAHHGNPDIDRIVHLNLYEGQRVKHELLYGVVKDRKSGAFHHDYATFRTLRKTKATPWKADAKASFTLSEDKVQELSKALDFLAECRGQSLQKAAARQVQAPPDTGQGDHGRLIDMLDGLDPQDQLEIVFRLLRDLRARYEPRQLMALLEQADDAELASTSRLFEIAVWRRSLREFHRLMKDPETTPGEYCAHFMTWSWLLGAEASETLDPTVPGLEDTSDLLLLRSPDNWLEIVLIRTPLADPRLFHGDGDNCWFPVPELSMALSRGQALMEKLTPESLMLEEEWTLQGRRARIIIGHLHGDPVQEQALQRFNRYSRDIEVLSYDQVDRSAIRALKRLQAAGK